LLHTRRRWNGVLGGAQASGGIRHVVVGPSGSGTVEEVVEIVGDVLVVQGSGVRVVTKRRRQISVPETALGFEERLPERAGRAQRRDGPTDQGAHDTRNEGAARKIIACRATRRRSSTAPRSGRRTCRMPVRRRSPST